MSVQGQVLKERAAEERVYFAAAHLLGVKGRLAHARSPLEIHAILSGGLPGRAVTNLRRHCRVLIGEGAFEQALGMSLRTVQRLEADEDKHLSSEQSSRAWKLAEIVARATSVFGSQEAAEEWLSKPARALEGKRPTELLATQTGTQLVEDLLQQIDYGVYV
jgi:putative toxin-antitoxin system antitoxin component (TIGR02293 family)